MYLPAGFEPIETGAGVWHPETQKLTLKVTETKGEVVFSVPADGIGPYPLSAGLFYGGKELSTAEINLTEEGFTELPTGAGEAQSPDGRVKVYFSEGATTEALAVRVRQPSQENQPPTTLSGHEFEIYAQSTSSKLEVSQFQQPITITVAYDPDSLWAPEEGLKLFYYDESYQDWRILPSWVDAENHLLIATSDHLTVLDYDIQTMETARTPTLESFQVANFTGAATYSLPIWAPPGPGGLQPDLALTYNSQVIDSATKETQASFVGMGWSLDTGYVERNTHGTDNYELDDTFSIVTNGISSLLLEGSDGYYHTTDESFWRIEFDEENNIWMAWDKGGNQYFFEHQAVYHANLGVMKGSNPNYDCELQYGYTWRWSLTKIRNIYGQELLYDYQVDQRGSPCLEPHYYYSGDWAVYPDTITYPNGRYRVKFNLEARNDYKSAWTSIDSPVRYLSQKLDEILVEYDADRDGYFEDDGWVRKYDLVYDVNYPIMYGLVWPGTNGKTPALKEVREYGLDDDSLPATSFSYDDGLHLTSGENNYGGKIDFEYQAWNENKATENTKKYSIDDFCTDPDTSPWSNHGTAGRPSCHNDEDLVVIRPIEKPLPEAYFMYGAYYKVSIRANAFSGGAWIRAGLSVDGVDQWTPPHSLPVYMNNDLGSEFVISGTITGSMDSAKILLDANNALMYEYRITTVPSRYRVVEKRVYDQDGAAPQVFTYHYDGAAMNDEHTSTSASTRVPYNGKLTEFRGHAMVQDEGPGGGVSTTFFHQDDTRSGRGYTTMVGTQSLWEPFDGLDGGIWQVNPGSGLITATRYLGDKALKSYNPTTSWNTQITRTNSVLMDAPGYANTIYVQFQITGTAQARLFIDTGQGQDYRAIGVYAHDSDLDAQYHNGSDWQQKQNLLSDFAADKWYVLQITADDGSFYLRVFERDNGAHAGELGCTPVACSFSSGQAWRFAEQTYNGTVYLDTYSEGRIFSLENTAITSSTFITASVPISRSLGVSTPFTGMGITWTRTISTTYLNFNGDGEWSGTRSLYEYNQSEQGDAQYGNVTRVLEEEWDPAQSQWKDYRLSLTRYYPNTSGVNLVGLPAFNNTFKCPEDAYDDACSSDYTGDPPDSLLISSSQYLYDDNTSYNQPPISGTLSVRRNLLEYDDQDNPLYQDTKYEYDAWGNVTSQTVYTDPGVGGTLASSGEETSSTAYDPLLHTYVLSTTNALGQTSLLSYDYRLGLPTAEIAPTER